MFHPRKTALMLSLSIRNFLGTSPKNARNPQRFARVTNLSFSCSSLLAPTVCLVRIRQATARPRLISLPTQFCGIIVWLVTATTQAPWLRMGTEGTRGQARSFGEMKTNVCSFALSLLNGSAACLIPSLNLFAAPTHHRPQSVIELFTCPFPRALRGDPTDGAFRRAHSPAMVPVVLPRTGAKPRV
jgi:hypothetical protein